MREVARLVYEIGKVSAECSVVPVLMANYIVFLKIMYDALEDECEKEITEQKMASTEDAIKRRVAGFMQTKSVDFQTMLRKIAIAESIEQAKQGSDS